MNVRFTSKSGHWLRALTSVLRTARGDPVVELAHSRTALI
jgi:hypothetical protein